MSSSLFHDVVAIYYYMKIRSSSGINFIPRFLCRFSLFTKFGNYIPDTTPQQIYRTYSHSPE